VIRAAGGLVVRTSGARTEVLVIHRPKYDDWSFPKGKLENGERDEDAALREVEEETGCTCRLLDEVGCRSYRDRHGRPKEVRYWQMEVIADTGFAPNDEVDERRWVSFVDAATLLTYADDRDLLDSLEDAR
jgi:8-oxo-dGTP diphosphatase